MVALSALIGCQSGIVGPRTVQGISTSTTVDGMKYTFAVPKSSLGIHDTLQATMTITNLSAKTDTLGINTGWLAWTLKDSLGKTVMWGPQVVSWNVIEKILPPGQSTLTGRIYAPIVDSVSPGSYVLSATGVLNVAWGTPLSLTLTIQ
jgi:hypothetical protein